MIKYFLGLLLCSQMLNAQVNKTMKRLPDTGQTNSYTNTFGEDNDYNINTPYYTNNNNGTITDTVTGLQWQAIDGGEMTYEKAKIYCDTLTLGGFTDWRLPTAQEAFSIMNLQNNNPALNTQYFPNTNAEYWWTSERQANDSNKIWCTNAGGGIGNHPKSETISAGGTKRFHTRAVREMVMPTIVSNHFTDNNDGTITDNITNLMWQKTPNATTLSWEQAISYAENNTLAGYTDWRLPNIKELQSLNDESKIQPSVTIPYFQNYGVNKFWSSTSINNQATKAWYWSTAFGITTYDDKLVNNSVVCVRNASSIPMHTQTIFTEEKNIFYPNPFDKNIFLGKNSSNQNVVMFDIYGKIIYQGNALAQQDFSSLQKGIYLIRLDNSVYKLLKK